MKKTTLLRLAVAAAMGLSIAACDLAIENPTQGDQAKVLGTPDDAEALISTYFKRWMNGVYGSTGDIEGEANVMSLMNYSSLANNCQNNHLPFAGATITNTPGNVCSGEQGRLYQVMNEVARVSSTFLQQLDSGMTLGQTLPFETDARNLRARAWAEFLRGISLGYIAMVYDSSSIPSPNNDQTEPECNREPLSGKCTGQIHAYTEVMDSAYAAFDRSLTLAQTTPNPKGDGFPIPDTWYPTQSGVTWDVSNFVRLVRSYRARIRANVARSSTEPVDWAAVVADAQNGLTDDHYIVTNRNDGPFNAWRQQYNSFDTWHQMPPFIIGMADTSSGYAQWIALPLGSRGAGNTGFFMITPDLRFPQGKDRAAQQGDFTLKSCEVSGTACKRYFYNRPSGDDVFSGQGWGWSNYGFARFRGWAQKGDGGTGRNGRALFMSRSELDLLEAEGLYKLGGQDVQVATLINKTRTAVMDTEPQFKTPKVARGGGLPAVLPVRTSAATGTLATGCVPRVPVAAQGPLVCGDLWEALKYEKRIETAYVSFAPWYFDSRRWDDLPKDTPLWWPVPFGELQARGRAVTALYGTGIGSTSAPNSAALGSAYGW